MKSQEKTTQAISAEQLKKEKAKEEEGKKFLENKVSLLEREVFELKQLVRPTPQPLVNSLPKSNDIKKQFLIIVNGQNYKEAIDLLKSLANLPDLTIENKIAINYQIALSYQFLRELDKSTAYYNTILAQVNELKQKDKLLLMGSVYNNLGLIEESKRTKPSNTLALDYFSKSELYFSKVNNQSGVANAMLNKAAIFNIPGTFKKYPFGRVHIY